MSAAVETEFGNGTAVVVFGLDESGKAHASAFAADLAEQAETAAGLMGMRVLRPETDEQRAVAAKLPRGRVFASGRAFVPFVARPLYESLVAFGGVQVGHQPGRPESACTGSPGAVAGRPGREAGPTAPVTVDDIEVGSVVLATPGGVGDGWFESVVIGIDDDDLLTLKWRDYPKDRAFKRRRRQLALLPQELAAA